MTIKLLFGWRLRVWHVKPRVVARAKDDDSGYALPPGWEMVLLNESPEDEALVERIWPMIEARVTAEVEACLGDDAAARTAMALAGHEVGEVVWEKPPEALKHVVAVATESEEPAQQPSPPQSTLTLNDLNAQIEATHAELQALPKRPDRAEEIVALQNTLRTLYAMRDRGPR